MSRLNLLLLDGIRACFLSAGKYKSLPERSALFTHLQGRGCTSYAQCDELIIEAVACLDSLN